MEEEQLDLAGLKQVQLAAVREILRATTSALPLQEILPLIANVTIIAFDALTAWLMLVEDGQLRMVIARGEGAAELAGTTGKLATDAAGVAALEQRPTILPPHSIDPTDPVLGPLAQQREPVVLLPIKAADQVLGLLGAVVSLDAVQDISFLVTLADQAAVAIADARLRAEVRTWRQRLDAVVEQMHDPVLVYDPHGTLVLLNAAAEQWLHGWGGQLGDSLAEVVRKTDLRDDRGQRIASVDTAEARALRGEVVDNLEQRIMVPPDRSTRHVLASAVPLRTDGRIDGAVVVWRDITARKQAEEQLQFQARLLDTVEQAVIAVDQAGTVTFWNRFAETLYGWSAAEALGRNIMDLTVPAVAQEQAQEIMAWLRAGETWTGEYLVQRRDGTTFPALVTDTPIRDADGNFIGNVGLSIDITARKQAEKERERLLAEIERERTRFAAVLQHMPIGVIIAEAPTGKLIFGNARAEQIWQQPLPNSTSITDYAAYRGFHADGRPYRPEEWPLARALTTGEVVINEEIRFQRGDGGSGVLNVNAAPICDAEGRITTAVVTFADITARKQVEEELRNSEARYRRLVETASEGIWMIDANSRTTYVNRRMVEILGYSEQEMLGRSSFDFVFPEDLDVGQQKFAQRKQGIAGHSEWRLRRKDGTAVWMQSSTSVIFDDNGAFVGVLGMFADITERKRAEEERSQLLDREQAAHAVARAAIERLSRLQAVTAALAEALTPHQVVESIIDKGMSVMGAQAGAVNWLCEAGTALEIIGVFGYAQDVVDAWRRFPVDTPIPLAEVVRTRTAIWLESGTDVLRRYPRLGFLPERMHVGAFVALPLLRGERTMGSLGIQFAGDRSFDAEERAYLLSLADLCAQALERAWLYAAEQRARAEAQEALRVRDAFLSIASHELKNPLTIVLGQAQLLQNRVAREETFGERDRRALAVIADQARQLNTLITGMLDVSRIEQGQLTIKRAPMDLCALTRRIAANVQPTLERHTLLCTTPDAPLIVDADALRIEQVLNNLISNAIKYSPQGGPVTIEVTQRGSKACVAVSDQGIGIPQEALSNLFQRFYRADNVTGRRMSGTGIGLYVVKELLTLHGGTVEVESSEGEGSTFTVCLPCAEAAE